VSFTDLAILQMQFCSLGMCVVDELGMKSDKIAFIIFDRFPFGGGIWQFSVKICSVL
jgi:hypothetical protein